MKDNGEKLRRIEEQYKDYIVDIHDLIGDDEPSPLFYLLIDKLGYLLQNDPEKVLCQKGIDNRKWINKVVKVVGPLFLNSKQIIEDRNALINPDSYIKDKGIDLPEEPVIWAPNHGFKDDALGSVLAASRNGYFLFGSLPQFYNTFDGITAWLNGSVIVNRKNKESRIASTAKCERVLDLGADMIIYPEGVWNKTPHLLSLKLWPGIYRIAKEKNVKIVPMIHYKRELHLKDKKDFIHTVIDDPIDVSNMSESQALNYLRDVYAYWLYLMMERYGQSTRKTEVGEGKSFREAWEEKLKDRISTADRYDSTIEKKADYRDKKNEEFLQAWTDIQNISNITPENISVVLEAQEKVKVLTKDNYQRRF